MNYANTIKKVVATLEGFILFFPTGFLNILIYDKQINICITII